MAALGSSEAMRMESPISEPDWDDDEPYIMTTIGEVPVQVFYVADRRGFVEIVRMCDEQGRDLPTYDIAFHALGRLRQECARECEQ